MFLVHCQTSFIYIFFIVFATIHRPPSQNVNENGNSAYNYLISKVRSRHLRIFFRLWMLQSEIVWKKERKITGILFFKRVVVFFLVWYGALYHKQSYFDCQRLIQVRGSMWYGFFWTLVTFYTVSKNRTKNVECSIQNFVELNKTEQKTNRVYLLHECFSGFVVCAQLDVFC